MSYICFSFVGAVDKWVQKLQCRVVIFVTAGDVQGCECAVGIESEW